MVSNRFAMLLAAIAVSASVAVAKPTLTIIPQRVVFSSLLQHVDVRVHIPANEPAFTGYISVCDTYNFATGNRFGTAVSVKPGEHRPKLWSTVPSNWGAESREARPCAPLSLYVWQLHEVRQCG